MGRVRASAEGDDLVSYFMRDLIGTSTDEAGEARIREFLRQLGNADDEHPDVALEHESAWSLSVFADRSVLWENLDAPGGNEQRVTPASWDDVVQLLLTLSRGEIENVQRSVDAPA